MFIITERNKAYPSNISDAGLQEGLEPLLSHQCFLPKPYFFKCIRESKKMSTKLFGRSCIADYKEELREPSFSSFEGCEANLLCCGGYSMRELFY